MALPREHLLDELATAYIQAIAATAGATIAVSRDYGVDGTLKHIVKSGDRYVESGFPVDFQLKGTTVASVRGQNVVYDLAVRNYNLLAERGDQATPYYLFLVCFGANFEQWVVEKPEQLILTASSYWWRQPGGVSDNVSTVRISIPVEQRLNSSALVEILRSASDRFAL